MVVVHTERQDSLHALRRLPGHIDAAHRVKLGFRHVKVSVQAAPLAPLRDDRKVGLRHVAHEEQNVDVTGLSAGRKQIQVMCVFVCVFSFNKSLLSPQDLHFIFEGLQLLRCWFSDL